MTLFYQEDFTDQSSTLNAEESQHLVKVLRKRAGDQIEVTNGGGMLFSCEVLEAHPRQSKVKVLATKELVRHATHRHIAIAPTKNIDRIEWFVEKAVEFGIDELSFVLCHHSERRVLKTERIKRKAISAMKQSGNLFLPIVNEVQPLQNFIANHDAEVKSIAYVDQHNELLLQDTLASGKHNLVLIGPEGDFSDEEVANALSAGFQKVSLGPSRLRTETAGIAAAHLMNIFCK
jgi:16S rRNA (uracil1498-N3)-methyltransferase